MKQINLGSKYHGAPLPCTGRLLWTWGLYGYAIWLVWHAFAGNPWAQNATWILAAAIGLALMPILREV
jgi:hypothetical protein